MASPLPDLSSSPWRDRVRVLTDAPVRDGDYVLYWMTSARRTTWNLALERAVRWAEALERPLLVFEPLRAGHRWASLRHQAFLWQGMEDNARALSGTCASYLPYVEPSHGDGRGLLHRLASRAALVVGDHSPAYFLPRMTAAAAKTLPARLEVVDGTGLLPLWSTDRIFHRAHDLRRHLHRSVADYLGVSPLSDPLKGARIPDGIRLPDLSPWPTATSLDALQVDRSVGAVALRGGPVAANARWSEFLTERLTGYEEHRNHPDEDGASGLSPYLHHGHISPHQLFHQLTRAEGWTPDRITGPPNGRREGFWGLSPGAEAFLDQLLTWRELGYRAAEHQPCYDQYHSLPDWARATLEAHEADPRPHLYPLDALESARTRDPIWNAAQRQLLREGVMHNYLRMLWGKRILEWTETPAQAFDAMMYLNDRYALDGRDPNGVAGVAWVMGRYDRAWGPERQVYGKIRYMSSENTGRKLRLRRYLARYGGR